MDSTLVITSMVVLIAILLIVGAPIKPVKLLGNSAVKLVIGVLMLFFFNVFGASIGLHVPINLFTAIIIGFLGIPGLASLTALNIFVLG
ncbi:pro-sigmaK processing inhibitor BofA family protein [Aquibacillus sp. 3ASR75-11]|uniref:Pro-sigmaK processing inhibitor BofA family protein n=1 Tax=Terrihalobacillus insolitus TaxID=2950438 RepID=A0A9X4AQ66_9BACI|nr:pro-sigmaK processing inhibitor BofA family protein [Terrihalobacillus insolitus]MDC3415252.1 pro-sigmaK processing inhibitor BofA family protein [Terrihalobacillus insolitus]MDC3426323.1 pro-sigmaK processing inhibitor BofA family protein [Terrihalobacillus insolitus]